MVGISWARNYDVVLCNSIRFEIDVIMQLAKPAGLSQHSDTLKASKKKKEKGEMGKRTEMKKAWKKVGSRCVSEYMNPSSFLTDLLQSSCLKL